MRKYYLFPVLLLVSCSLHQGIVLEQRPTFAEKREYKNSIYTYNKINYYFGIADRNTPYFTTTAKHDLNHSLLLESGDVIENISQDFRYTWFLFWLRKEVYISADIYHYPSLKNELSVPNIRQVPRGFLPLQYHYIIKHSNKKIFDKIHDFFPTREEDLQINNFLNSNVHGYTIEKVIGRRVNHYTVDIIRDEKFEKSTLLYSINVFDTYRMISPSQYEKIEHKRVQYRIGENEIKEVTLLGMNFRKCLFKTDDGKYEIGYSDRLIF